MVCVMLGAVTCRWQMDVWPEVTIEKEYTGFELEVEEPPLDEPR